MRRSEAIAEQAAQPRGLLGWIIGSIMSRETRHDNETAIDMLDIRSNDRVVDLGTGHGESLTSLAKRAHRGEVEGIDISTVMLGIARRKHRKKIRSGRIALHHASANALPFNDNSFDKALAVHTLYFWNPAQSYLREIARILKPGGLVLLAFRPAEDAQVVAKFPSTVYHFRSIAEVSVLIRDAGFSNIETVHRDLPGKSMVWLLATKEEIDPC